MPKFNLHRAGKIPTAVHPFVKQTALPEAKQKPQSPKGKTIRGVQNIAMSMSRTISTAIASWAQRFIPKRAMSKLLDRLKE